jgi:hypothetical protein
MLIDKTLSDAEHCRMTFDELAAAGMSESVIVMYLVVLKY